MGSRTTTHRLSGGLFVSGPLERPKDKPTPTSSAAAPYTGGDIKVSGDLGKMFELEVPSPRPHPTTKKSSSSSSFSGPLHPSLPTTGLITSGPSSASSSTRRSGCLVPEKTLSKKKSFGSAITTIGPKREYGFAISTGALLTVLLVLLLMLTLGVFLMIAVKSVVVLAVAATLVLTVAGLAAYNWVIRDSGLQDFLRGFPDTDLYGARNDHFVKVTGVVTCGSIPLETSFQRISRCAFVSTELHQYRGFIGKQANPNHKRLSWGLRYSEKQVGDFYISDNKRGVRALVKAGHGAKIVSFVKPATKLSIRNGNKEMHPTFTRWLDDSDISFDDHLMHLEEGYIKEGSTITVMGILQQHDNILMINPPDKPVATGFIWRKLLLPMHIKGLVLIGDENPNDEVITV